MAFHFVRHRTSAGGNQRELEWENGLSGEWIAGDGEWTICRYSPLPGLSWDDWNQAFALLQDDDRVSRGLEWLILSSWNYYPPAIALARDEVREASSREELAGQLGERLLFHLQRQRDSGFFLARCVADDGELVEGAWHWIVRWLPERGQVVYLSRDFYAYLESATSFDLPPDLLERLR